ncbi:MAG: hypothetical protein ABH844_00700 [Candidatus Omnitrophota bacterium]
MEKMEYLSVIKEWLKSGVLDVQSWLMLIVAIIYAFITYRILRATNLNTQETLRPKVYVDFSFDKGQHMYAVVKNYGKRSATDIKIKFEPDFKYGNDESLNNAPYIKAIPFLAPDNERRSLLGVAPELFEKNKANNILKVSIQYTDETKKPKYPTKYELSLDSFRVRFVDSK